MTNLKNFRILLPVLDIILIAASYLAAFALRYEFAVPPDQMVLFERLLPLLLTLRLLSLVVFRLYKGLWLYAGLTDLIAAAKAVAASSVTFILIVRLLGIADHSPSVFLIDSLTVFLLLAGARFSPRLFQQLTPAGPGRRVLIYGAGDAGEMIAREMLSGGYPHYSPVGFIDDDPAKMGRTIHGLTVQGGRDRMTETVRRTSAHEIVIAIPSAAGDQIRSILATGRLTGLPVGIVPGRLDIIEGEAHVSQIREVKLTDLLGREEVVLDPAETGDYLTGNSVMVTGAGGSIGLELCLQIARLRPERLILVERSEYNLYNLLLELGETEPVTRLVPTVADINDQPKLLAIMEEHRPTVMFHAAAHKHVPLLEQNPEEAFLNNFIGTASVAELAHKVGLGSFVLVSTDKAVNPSSFMGASKKLAEMFVQTFDKQSATRFVTVRFGNVLGSTGSVIPLFERQIKAGGPVTVTDPEVNRYFMTVQEAAQLILQAGAMGDGGEIFILDMGEPVRIADLARELIDLSGLEADRDIQIRYTGLRPGEKLTEELFSPDEEPQPTRHPKIRIAKPTGRDWEELREDFWRIEQSARAMDRSALEDAIRRFLPRFRTAQTDKAAGS
ncbi:polysaccharide biosynthesis protein [candidate division KSB1 bacterium]